MQQRRYIYCAPYLCKHINMRMPDDNNWRNDLCKDIWTHSDGIHWFYCTRTKIPMGSSHLWWLQTQHTVIVQHLWCTPAINQCVGATGDTTIFWQCMELGPIGRSAKPKARGKRREFDSQDKVNQYIWVHFLLYLTLHSFLWERDNRTFLSYCPSVDFCLLLQGFFHLLRRAIGTYVAQESNKITLWRSRYASELDKCRYSRKDASSLILYTPGGLERPWTLKMRSFAHENRRELHSLNIFNHMICIINTCSNFCRNICCSWKEAEE